MDKIWPRAESEIVNLRVRIRCSGESLPGMLQTETLANVKCADLFCVVFIIIIIIISISSSSRVTIIYIYIERERGREMHCYNGKNPPRAVRPSTWGPRRAAAPTPATCAGRPRHTYGCLPLLIGALFV